MAFLIYKINNKKVVKKFNDSYEVKNFLRDRSYHKKANFSGFLFPQKFLKEFEVASVNDILTVKRQGFEYVVKRGPEVYILPVPNKGFLKKILDLSIEVINRLIGRSLKSTEKRRHL